ncbi:MAG TPA: carboxypeptidase-like regulatory domain-containing protein, partial [Myxococcales bacterium]
MRLALPAALLLSACGLRTPRTTAQPCAATAQCDRSDVCFLGQCRGPSEQLSLVSAEVHPPNDLQFGLLQQANIDLHQLPVLHDFALQPPFGVAGQVRQEQNDGTLTIVVGAALTFIDHAPAIPDRVDKVIAKSDATGQFIAHLPAASWDLLLEPPSPLPPSRASSPLTTAAPALDLRLPPPSSLVQVNGSVSAAGVLLTGARIAAVDSAGLAISAPATTADGGFSLLLPPGTSSYYLEIGPPNDMDGGVTNSDPLPNYDQVPPVLPVNLPLTAAATLAGKVIDATGAGIASARVYARSTGTTQWSLSRSTSTAADGSYSLALRAGSYLVEAAPS